MLHLGEGDYVHNRPIFWASERIYWPDKGVCARKERKLLEPLTTGLVPLFPCKSIASDSQDSSPENRGVPGSSPGLAIQEERLAGEP
jgi:hypothetical protein